MYQESCGREWPARLHLFWPVEPGDQVHDANSAVAAARGMTVRKGHPPKNHPVECRAILYRLIGALVHTLCKNGLMRRNFCKPICSNSLVRLSNPCPQPDKS